MATTSGEYFSKIVQNISTLRQEVETKSKLGYTDLNKQCENLLRDILNIVFDGNFKNLNEKDARFPGIDVGDELTKVAFQISATKNGTKIENTLDLSLKYKHYEKFTSINVFVLTKKQGTYNPKVITQPYFLFDTIKNIWDFDDLLKLIEPMSLEKLASLSELLQVELPYIFNKLNAIESVPVVKNTSEIIPLIDPAITAARLNLLNRVLWSIRIEIIKPNDLTLNQFYIGLEQTKLVRDQRRLPFIMIPTYRSASDSKAICFIRPPSRGFAYNTASEEQLLLNGNSINYEFAQYTDGDFILPDLNTPLNSLVFLLLNVKKYFSLGGIEYQIKVTINVESSHKAGALRDSFPFDFGWKMYNYHLDNNKNQVVGTITKIDSATIYNLLERIYNGFICENNQVTDLFLSIDKGDFDRKFQELQLEFGLS